MREVTCLATVRIDGNGMVDHFLRRRDSQWLQINKYGDYGHS